MASAVVGVGPAPPAANRGSDPWRPPMGSWASRHAARRFPHTRGNGWLSASPGRPAGVRARDTAPAGTVGMW